MKLLFTLLMSFLLPFLGSSIKTIPVSDQLVRSINSNAKENLNRALNLEGDKLIKEDEIVIVNLWATWCAPCIQEVPELNELVEEYKGRPVRFLAFSNEDLKVYNSFLSKRPEFEFHYEQNFGNSEAVSYIKSLDEKFNGNAVPMHVLINADGSIDQVLLGASPIYPKMMRDFLDRQLSLK